MERRCVLVVVCAFFHIIGGDFARRDVAVVDAYAAVCLLVEYVVVVEKGLQLHRSTLLEHLIAVQTVLVGGDGAAHYELEHIGEEIHLRADGLDRIVESGVGVVQKTYLTVYVAAPHDVVRHLLLRGERYLCAYAQASVAGGCGLLLFASACCRLCRQRLGDACQKQYEQYFFHIFDFCECLFLTL